MIAHAAVWPDCWCFADPDTSNPHPRRCTSKVPHGDHGWWDEHEPDATKFTCPGIPASVPWAEWVALHEAITKATDPDQPLAGLADSLQALVGAAAAALDAADGSAS